MNSMNGNSQGSTNSYVFKVSGTGYEVGVLTKDGQAELGWCGYNRDRGNWVGETLDQKILYARNRQRVAQKLYDRFTGEHGRRRLATVTAPKPIALIEVIPVRYRKTRESWLTEVATGLAPLLAAEGYPPGKFRISVAPLRPSRLGECWRRWCSADGTAEIFISASLTDPMMIAAVIAHELIHAALSDREGHSIRFRKIEHALGLSDGRQSRFYEEPKDSFTRAAGPILRRAGKYPHEALKQRRRS